MSDHVSGIENLRSMIVEYSIHVIEENLSAFEEFERFHPTTATRPSLHLLKLKSRREPLASTRATLRRRLESMQRNLTSREGAVR